ncbi:MAG TPA: MFS transporter [Candidatus Angelobacter sp.]|jgi:D-galactonate transporter|nr:MFS transporter [Candidatus Angelobacter sp.]
MTASDIFAEPVADRARRRITRRILPYLFILFIVAYLDRVNVSYAALEMTKDLNFSPEVYGFGAGIFFAGYFLLEIPGAILVEKWSARAWIARIMISWGVVAILTGFVHTATQFYWIRFLLGAAEAGFFPGIIVYLNHWFRYEDRAKAVAMFMAALPISNMVGSPISGWLLGINWLRLQGWRWLFIFEGIPAVMLGVITLLYLTDWPHQAKWLPDDERQWITSELEREKRAKQKAHRSSVWQTLRERRVILLSVAYFFIVTAVYGFTFWLPTIIKKLSGFSNRSVSLLSALPYCVGLAAILLVGWSSDRTGERRWHTACSMMVAGIGLALGVVSQNFPLMTISMFSVAAAGIYGYLPGFWSLPTSFLTGTVAAASIGMINSIGNLGGFAGPYIVGYLNRTTHSFSTGVIYLSLSAMAAATLVLTLRSGGKKEQLAVETSV